MTTSEAMECFARDMDLNFAAWVKLNQHVICLAHITWFHCSVGGGAQ